MQVIAIILLIVQPPIKPESTLWVFKIGQEFYIEETQRQFNQITGSSQVSSYFDCTFLWRYHVQSEQAGDLKIQATLEKVRVNNPNEAGGRASETLKQQEGTQSTWLLKTGKSGWEIRASPDDARKHAAPLILTLGSKQFDQDQSGWKQQWPMPESKLGSAQLELAMKVRQQTTERLSVYNRGKFSWKASRDQPALVELSSAPSAIQGLGEYDLSKGRWLYFEWRAEGNWQLTSNGVSVNMKQSQFNNYRFHERRPNFP